MEFLFYSPLEQFEFSVIGGKMNNVNVYELLSPNDKKNPDLSILLGNSPYRSKLEAELNQYFHFIMGFAEPRFFLSPNMREIFYKWTIDEALKEQWMSGPLAVIFYKNLDFFYTQEKGLELVTIYAKVFEELLADNKVQSEIFSSAYNPNKQYIVFFNQEISNDCVQALEYEEETYSILAAYVLTDMYCEYSPYGINPTLYYLTLNFYGWISDRVFLNDLTGETFGYTIENYLNNVRGLSALEMTNRDYSAFTFYWLNIYNSLFIVISLIILIFIIFNQGHTKVQNVWQILNTLTFDFLLKSFISLANKNLLSFFPIFFCFFIFIYFLNLTALTPFSFCLTSNLWFSLSLSFSVWFGVTTLAIIVRGENFLIGFVPKNIASNELKVFITIIEVISYVARSLSLGVRIFANMLAGHSLVHILSDLTATCFVEFDNIGLKIAGIFPAIILSFILVIEFGICFLQGLVFVILTAIYLKEAFEGH